MKLIKINIDHYVVVDNSEIKEGDWFINEANNIEQGIGNYPYKSLSPECKKITYSTQPFELLSENGLSGMGFSKVRPLNIFEVKELLGEVDVEKEMISPYPMDTQNDVDWCNGYQRGYNQALEDKKDRKYTEEDILNILYDYDNVDWSKREHKQSVIMMKEWLYEKLQSFQPKTEWNVEIVDGKLKLI